jgi:lysophospholipase L1-like esterase
MKVVCIGNSIVNGFPHRRSRSFPSVLRTLTGWEVINKGVNGDTTGGVLERFPHDVLAHRPDLVLILTGTNDFILGLSTPEEALENLAQMARTAREAGIRPVLLTPVGTDPDQAAGGWMAGAGIDYRDVNARLEVLSQGIRGLAADGTCGLVDLELKYKGFGKFVDGIHPTEEGQEKLARWIAEVLNGEKQT